jgi:hypothetical protein
VTNRDKLLAAVVGIGTIIALIVAIGVEKLFTGLFVAVAAVLALAGIVGLLTRARK